MGEKRRGGALFVNVIWGEKWSKKTDRVSRGGEAKGRVERRPTEKSKRRDDTRGITGKKKRY